MSRSFRRMAAIGGLIASIACSNGDPPVCRPVAFSVEAETALPAASARVDFAPRHPCAFDEAFLVTSAFVDALPGQPSQPRIHFVVTRSDEPAFVFSQTRAPVHFSAIPQGSRSLRVVAGAAVGEGFVGPSGSGQEIAYLRWRVGGVTYELSATLASWLTERDLRAVAAGLMEAQAVLSLRDP